MSQGIHGFPINHNAKTAFLRAPKPRWWEGGTSGEQSADKRRGPHGPRSSERYTHRAEKVSDVFAVSNCSSDGETRREEQASLCPADFLTWTIA